MDALDHIAATAIEAAASWFGAHNNATHALHVRGLRHWLAGLIHRSTR